MTGSDDQMMVVGVVWRDHKPLLRVKRGLAPASELVPIADQRLSYRIDGEARRTCIGHVPFRSGAGDYHDCRNAPRSGSRVCEKCAIVEATFASNLHHAHTRGSSELDPAIRRHLDQPNRLYLAAFRDGSIKIGTSTLTRSERRLEEQGAWIATFVAETPNGRAVRFLEDAVTEELGLPQAVSAVRKLRGLVDPVDDATLSARLIEHAESIETQVVSSSPDATPLNQRWRHPMADLASVRATIGYPLRLERGRHDLELITAVGRHLIARRPGGSDIFAFDPMPIFGLWLDLGDYGSDEIAIQDSLF